MTVKPGFVKFEVSALADLNDEESVERALEEIAFDLHEISRREAIRDHVQYVHDEKLADDVKAKEQERVG